MLNSQQLVPLLAVVLVAGAGVGFVVFTRQQQQVQQLRAALERRGKELAAAQRERDDLAQEADGLRQERAQMEERISALRGQLTSASDDLEEARLGWEALKRTHDESVTERSLLKAQVEGLTGERDGLRSRISSLERDRDELERAAVRFRERLALMDRDYQRLQEQLAEAKSASLPGVIVVGSADPGTSPASSASSAPGPLSQTTVELPPIIVRKNAAGMSVPVRGRVMEVNDAHKFLVLDKGMTDGIRVGMMFDIVRGTTTVGRATVVRVRPQLSACDIVTKRSAGAPQSGDLAVQAGP